jgi:predicted lipoprotein with Yx(FWY)xxD motif
MSRAIEVLFLILCISIVAVPSAWAFWVQDGVAVTAATGNQWSPAIASDGTGGAIIAWYDDRSGGGNSDIYVQRVGASGIALWTSDGVPLCTAAGNQTAPVIAPDGAGGAIVAWQDYRNGNNDIFVQRVNASGAVLWTSNGVSLCTLSADQSNPAIASDGAGGAVVVWSDARSGSDSDIYAQRVNGSGAVQWTANGVAVCTAMENQRRATVVADGAGGVIVSWEDWNSGDQDIYAQKVNASGAAQWTTDGVPLCTWPEEQATPKLVSDGAGGAVVAWLDNRNVTGYDVYAQRITSSGSVQWTTDGVGLCTATGYKNAIGVVSDGGGGAIVTWLDGRSGDYDIYARRVNASGSPGWTSNGVPLCAATGAQYGPAIASDGAGGAIVTWYDDRAGIYDDVYAQRVNGSGAVQWTANGVAICTSNSYQAIPAIVADGIGGAIVTWQDGRSLLNYDIYAQFIDSRGRTGYLAPSIYAVRDVPGDQGGNVYLSWYGARIDVFMDPQMSYYSVWRAINPTSAAFALEEGVSLIEDLSAFDGSNGKPVIRIERAAGRTFFWELVHRVDALYMNAYGKAVATLFDSTSVCDEYHYFQIVAHTTTPSVFWKSEPDSGYSVDNLIPCPPVGLAGKQSFTPEGLELTWDRNTEADLGHYAVYRGSSSGFAPNEGNLVASPCDTMLLDTGWRWNGGYYYKVSAVDVHGNESGFALLTPDGVTDVETPKAPAASYLAQNFPNPFNPTTRIAFGLGAPADVSLRIYDAAGRLVRVLAEGARPAGNYAELWDGRDSGGRAVASGIYFYRLQAGAFSETRKMTLLR